MQFIPSLNDEQDLKSLHPHVARKVRKLMEAMSEIGLPCTIVSAYRSFRQQNELYAKGRTADGRIVTQAKGGQSYHNYGLAADLLPLVCAKDRDWAPEHQAWKMLGVLAEKMGFVWGGRFGDRPHIEYTRGMHYSQLKMWHDEGGLDAVWARLDLYFKPSRGGVISTKPNDHAR